MATNRSGYRGYIASRTFMGERAPQHVQNLVIRDYCQNRGYDYLLSATEYAVPNCFMMLEQVIQEAEAETIAGIIAYSMFMLPETRAKRFAALERVLATGTEFHFAVEDLRIVTADDIPAIDALWRLRQSVAFCPQGV